MNIYGYARVSTPTQNIERQIRNIKEVCSEAVIYKESYTGTTLDRPEWKKLYRKLKTGDKVIFDSVSRMSRNADDGVALYEELLTAGVDLMFIKEPHINTEVFKRAVNNAIPTTGNEIADLYIETTNKVIILLAKEQIKLAFEQSQKEVDDMRERTKEGIETARIAGKKIGRQKGQVVITQKAMKIKDEIIKKSKDFGGKFNDKELINIIGCSTNTYYKYKKELRDAV